MAKDDTDPKALRALAEAALACDDLLALWDMHRAITPATVLALLDRLEAAEDDAERLHREKVDVYHESIREKHRAETAERELAEALKLAWPGEHRFPDQSYKAMFEDVVASLRQTDRELAEARAALARVEEWMMEAPTRAEVARLRRIEEAARVCLDNYDDVADSEGADIKALRAALKEGRSDG